MANQYIQKFVAYLGKDPIYPFRGPLSPLMCGVAWAKEGSDPFYILVINKGRDSFYAINERAYFDYAQKMFKKYMDSETTIQERQAAYADVTGKIDTLYSTVTTSDLGNASEKDLVSWLTTSGNLLTDLVASTLYIETFDKHIALPILGKEKSGMLERIWEQATHPAFMSFEGRRLRDILSALSGEEPSESLARKVKYIYTDYFSAKSTEEVLALLKDIARKREEKDAEMAKYEADLKKAQTTHDAWIKTLSEEELYLVSYIQFVMELRDLRKDPIAKSQGAMYEIGSELFRRAGMPEAMCYALFPPEYSQGVAGLVANKEKILARKDGFIGMIKETGDSTGELGNFDALLKEFNEVVLKKSSGEQMFKGQIANKGKVAGKVRIVLDPHDDKGFVQGDILVTSMTRPEFVPLMKKAGAVITNEGGITCHAAIVSRELGIPCIIGTKVATQVLKDGMTVEVDANTGVVKIIS